VCCEESASVLSVHGHVLRLPTVRLASSLAMRLLPVPCSMFRPTTGLSMDFPSRKTSEVPIKIADKSKETCIGW
jgi:hypothetical protein